jgi:hypothetical protein
MSNLFGNDYDGRKSIPIFEGVIMYFPKALAAVAEVSHAGNQQHNPGEPLHWARGKSMDQYNTALRHLMDHRMGGGRHPGNTKENNGWIPEPKDTDGVRHLAKAAWRVLAALQLAIEEEELAARQSSEPVPSPVTAPVRCVNCHCGQWVLMVQEGSLPPCVVDPRDGITHTERECR